MGKRLFMQGDPHPSSEEGLQGAARIAEVALGVAVCPSSGSKGP